MAVVPPPLVRPFRALRHRDASRLSQRIAPPYDVISSVRRAELAASDPHNIVHLMLPEAKGNRYAHAAKLLGAWLADDILTDDAQPTVTIMRQEFVTPDGTRHTRMGLFAGVRAEPYGMGRVLPHERTHWGPKQDRLALLRATRTALEPLFMVTRDSKGALATFLADESGGQPDLVAHLDGVDISLWIVPAGRAVSVVDAVGAEPLYIADGHHRYETAAAYAAERKDEDRVIGFVVSVRDPGLFVLPTHRIVRGSHVDAARIPEVIGSQFRVTTWDDWLCTVVLPGGVEIAFAAGAVSDGRDELGDRLAIARVERHVVRPILEASGAGAELDYTPDANAARSAVVADDASAAVLVRPTPVADVLEVADARGYMPPKSTYFYPKVPAGLVVYPLAKRLDPSSAQPR